MGEQSPSVSVVAGPNLDRAWPELGLETGRRRREAAVALLRDSVRSAREAGADALVVLGSLVDRPTVMQRTLDQAYRTLQAFRGPVLVVPGPRDWLDVRSPYRLTTPPDLITVAGSGPDLAVGDMLLVGAPVIERGGTASLPERGDPSAWQITLLPGPADGGLPLRPRDPRELILVAQDGSDEPANGVFAVPPVLVPDPSLRLVAVTPHGPEIQTRVLGPGIEAEAHLDVTGRETSAALRAALEALAEQHVPAVRLSGTLRHGVVLPAESSVGVRLHVKGLHLEFEAPPETDRSTRAQFVRDLMEDSGYDLPGGSGEELARHQAIAVGLAAFGSLETDVRQAHAH